MKEDQKLLFDNVEWWREYWVDMPEFKQKNLMPWQTVNVHFRCREDRKKFEKLIGQHLTDKSQYLWFPEKILTRNSYEYSPAPPNKHSVYIISKGRSDTRLTSLSLDNLCIPYHIVIEPQEFDQYSAVIDESKILVLPFSDLGQGSIPARNWVWEHSIKQGASHHWILDDNINGFYRLINNKKTKVTNENPFIHVEKFVERYENLAIAGLNYEFFAKSIDPIPPFYLNTRVYSCLLIRNDIPHRWRGRYNEDTDLCLRILKDGNCTFLSNAFLAKKIATMVMTGGNTDELYRDDGRLKMAQSLVDQHPDVAKITWKWGRWQHHVDYTPFKDNKLIPTDEWKRKLQLLTSPDTDV